MNTTINWIQSQVIFYSKIVLFLTKIFKTVMFSPYKTAHACNKLEGFPLECPSPSGDGQHWLKNVKAVLY
jgi:hypothetical protein